MFNSMSNAAFNNVLFSSAKIAGMHKTMIRLYEAAWALQKTKGQSAVARLLNASPQTVKNWESRGVSRAGMIDAQRLIGCRPTWIETGDGRMEDGPTPDSTETPLDVSTPAVDYEQIKAVISGVLNAYNLNYADLVPNEASVAAKITSKLCRSSNTGKPVVVAESIPRRTNKPGQLDSGVATDASIKESPHKRAEGER